MKLKIILPLVLVAGLIGLALLLPRILVGQIQGRLEQQLTVIFGPPVSIGDVGLNLFDGPKLSLRDVKAGTGTKAISIDHLDLELALKPLLKREVEIVAAKVDSLHLSWKIDPNAVTTGDAGSGAIRGLGSDGSGQARATESSTGAADPGTADATGKIAAGDTPTGSPGSDSRPLPSGGNADQANARGGTPSSEKFKPLAITVQSFEMSNARIQLYRADDTPLVEIEGLANQLTVSSRAEVTDLTGNLRANEVRFHLPGGGTVGDRIPIRLDTTLRFDANTDRLALTSAVANLGELPLSLDGEVTAVRTAPNATLHLEGGPAEVSGIAGFLPSRVVPALDGMRSSGTVALKADVRGPVGPGVIPDFDVQLDLTNGSIEHPALPEPLRGIVLHLHADPEQVDIQTLSAESARSRFQVAGTITDYRSAAPQLAFDVDGDVDLTLVSKLQPPKPDQPDLSGRAAGKLRVQGPLGAKPDQLGLVGTVDLTDVVVSGGTMESPVNAINGRVQLDNRAASTDRVSFSTRGSDLVVSGNVDDYWAFLPEATDRRARVNLRLQSPRLDLDAWMPPPGATPRAGVSSGAPNGAGTSESGAGNSSSGADRRSNDGSDTGAAGEGASASSQVAPSGAPTDASTDGNRAKNASPGQTTADQRSGASSPTAANDALAAARTSGGDADARLLAIAILSRLDGPIAVDVAQARVRGVDVTRAVGNGSLSRGKITVQQLSFDGFGGTMRMNGWVDLSQPDRPTMDLDLLAGGLRVQDLFTQAKQVERVAQIAQFVNGRVDLEAKLQGSMDSDFQLDLATLTSLGKLAFREGRIQGHPFQAELAQFLNADVLRDVPIREWLQPFELRAGRLEYKDLKISAGGVDLLANGWQSLEGKMQMTAELRLPASLSSGLKRAVPAELQQLVFEPEDGRILVPIKASGPTSAPKISLDSQALAAQVQSRLTARAAAERQKLEDAAVEEIQKLEDRAKDEVEKALGDKVGDVLGGLAGRDSANADSTANLEDQLEGVLKGLFKKKR